MIASAVLAGAAKRGLRLHECRGGPEWLSISEVLVGVFGGDSVEPLVGEGRKRGVQVCRRELDAVSSSRVELAKTCETAFQASLIVELVNGRARKETDDAAHPGRTVEIDGVAKKHIAAHRAESVAVVP
eukprot:CAMPEP_0176158704 /NCGR_PEP_ID=MMETSP0120_2-20121206/81175_1 /TAXON_ID=160619 /ORGANISM="Kryptoperidinium foliaceum, Strain CCMP 1326" /LENGTH=128 /DNA_ID=CAMNT_0017496083 /DNA_START=77 /DNA_END=461 /DNA_ORIENTATION=-